MIDRELEQILHTRFRSEAARAGSAPAALSASVLGIPDRIPYGAARNPTRRVLLLAATVLLTMVVGGAVAIGSGLIRLPQPPDILPGPRVDAISTALVQPLACDLTLDDDLALETKFSDSSGRPAQLTVDTDGWVVRGPEPWLPEEGIPWEQRMLTTGGLTRLLADVESSGLRDCIQVPGPGPTSVSARLGDAVVAMGFGGWSLRTPTETELDAGEILAARFNDPDLGAASDEWVDPAWRPYEPDRMQLMLHQFLSIPCCWMPGDYDIVEWEDVTLPDGSTYLTVGGTYPPPPEASGLTETRCLVIPAADRETWIEALGEPDGPDHLFWMFANGEGGAGWQVMMTPLLPSDSECQGFPDPSPRQNLIEGLDVCALVPESAAWGNGRPLDDHGWGWASCEYYPAAVPAWVFASRHPVTTEEAPAVAANQFGEGFTTDEVAGHPVYLNSCVEPDPDCSAAIALSAAPYFVILVPEEQNTPERLLAWAEMVIESVSGPRD